MPEGRFICIEGVEGSGKTTQIALLDERLRRDGRRTLVTREPGGTALGEAIREILLSRREFHMSPTCELLLFEAARAQHVSEVLRPALASGTVVLSDRFSASTFAYQCAGLGVSEGLFEAVDAAATGGLRPHLTIILDVPPEVGMARKRGDAEADRIEQRDAAFHARVRDGYLRFAQKRPDATAVVDATPRVQDVHAQIVAALGRRVWRR